MSHDEKTTELELPQRRGNIVHVNFFGQRPVPPRTPSVRTHSGPAEVHTLRRPRPKRLSPWFWRLVAVAAIVALSLLVL